jgi:hypothetical protein
MMKADLGLLWLTTLTARLELLEHTLQGQHCMEIYACYQRLCLVALVLSDRAEYLNEYYNESMGEVEK